MPVWHIKVFIGMLCIQVLGETCILFFPFLFTFQFWQFLLTFLQAHWFFPQHVQSRDEHIKGILHFSSRGLLISSISLDFFFHQLYWFSTTFKINPWLAPTISYQSIFKILHCSTNRILNWVSHNLQLSPNFHFHSASLGLRMEKLISMVLSWLGFWFWVFKHCSDYVFC